MKKRPQIAGFARNLKGRKPLTIHIYPKKPTMPWPLINYTRVPLGPDHSGESLIVIDVDAQNFFNQDARDFDIRLKTYHFDGNQINVVVKYSQDRVYNRGTPRNAMRDDYTIAPNYQGPLMGYTQRRRFTNNYYSLLD